MKGILLTGGALILSTGFAFAQTTGSQAGANQASANQPGINQTGVNQTGTLRGGTGTAANNGGNAAGISSGSRFSNNQIEARLRREGYNSFTHVRDHNGYFRANARRYGKAVNNIKVSERTGQVQNQNKLNDQQVQVLLAEKGYKDILKVTNSNNHTMMAHARMGGVEHTLYVNALTGHVTQKS